MIIGTAKIVFRGIEEPLNLDSLTIGGKCVRPGDLQVGGHEDDSAAGAFAEDEPDLFPDRTPQQIDGKDADFFERPVNVEFGFRELARVCKEKVGDLDLFAVDCRPPFLAGFRFRSREIGDTM
jgi:hypothetical protein